MEKDKVVDYLDSSEVLAQLAEECSGSGRRESHPGDTGGSYEQFD